MGELCGVDGAFRRLDGEDVSANRENIDGVIERLDIGNLSEEITEHADRVRLCRVVALEAKNAGLVAGRAVEEVVFRHCRVSVPRWRLPFGYGVMKAYLSDGRKQKERAAFIFLTWGAD